MADEFIGFTLTGDRSLSLRFDEFPRKLHDRFLAKVREITARLADAVRADAPHGKTGKLANSVVERVYDDGPARIKGRVTVSRDFAKAAALEYGAHKRTKVSAHAMRLDHVFANRLAAPLTVAVGAYSRTPNIEATRFMRGPLAAAEAEIAEELRAVVDAVIAEDE
jgi:hypothetical protein